MGIFDHDEGVRCDAVALPAIVAFGGGQPQITARQVAPVAEPVCDALMDESPVSEDDRWIVIGGRRWRRTDPCLPPDAVEALTSHLGRGRSGVGAAKRRDDEEAVARARRRVDLAKHGLGERGPRWWEDEEPARIDRAREALHSLQRLDEHP